MLRIKFIVFVGALFYAILSKAEYIVEHTIDLNPGDNSSYANDLVELNGGLFFFGNDGVTGFEPWYKNKFGTTFQLKDINEGSNGSHISPGSFLIEKTYHIVLSKHAYFIADDGMNISIWKTDGKKSGTVKIKNIGSSNANFKLASLRIFQNQIYISTSEGLWKTDGSTQNTTLVLLANQFSSGFEVVGDYFVFAAPDGVIKRYAPLTNEIVTFDPVVRVRDNYSKLGAHNNTHILYINIDFNVQTGDGFNLLNVANATSESLLYNRIGHVGRGGQFSIELNGFIYLCGHEAYGNPTWYRSDGTVSGTTPIGLSNSCRTNHAVKSENEIYILDYIRHTSQLSIKNIDTAGNLTTLKNLTLGTHNYNPQSIKLNQNIFFSAKDPNDNSSGIWQYNLNTGGVTKLSNAISLSKFIRVDDEIYTNMRFLSEYKIGVVKINPTQTPEERYSGYSLPLDGSGKGVIIITHGWNSDVDTWSLDMAKDICNNELSGIWLSSSTFSNTFNYVCWSQDWDILLFDWREKAGTVSPRTAWNHGIELGKFAGKYLKTLNYSHLHLIAHSAGSNLMESTKDWLIENQISPKPTIQMTFFDAYEPKPNSIDRDGKQISSYGDGTIWSDNYFDTRLVLPKSLDRTELQMPTAFNIDVTKYDDRGGFQSEIELHAWPYRFYHEKTIKPYSIAVIEYPFGFRASKTVIGDDFPLSSNRPIGKLCTLGDTSITLESSCEKLESVPNYTGIATSPRHICLPLMCDGTVPIRNAHNMLNYSNVQNTDFAINTSNPTQSTTGNVMIDGSNQTLTLTTGNQDPVWYKLDFTILNKVNILEFDYEFPSNSEGYLTLYVNNVPEVNFDERLSKDVKNTTHRIHVGDLEPGTYSLGFRLQPHTTTASIAKINEIRFSYIDSKITEDEDLCFPIKAKNGNVAVVCL